MDDYDNSRDQTPDFEELAELFYDSPELIGVANDLPIESDLQKISLAVEMMREVEMFNFQRWERAVNMGKYNGLTLAEAARKNYLPSQLLSMRTIMTEVQGNYKNALTSGQQDTTRATDLEIVLHITLQRALEYIDYSLSDEGLNAHMPQNGRPPVINDLSYELNALSAIMDTLVALKLDSPLEQMSLYKVYEYINKLVDISMYDIASGKSMANSLDNDPYGQPKDGKSWREKEQSNRPERIRYKKRYEKMRDVIELQITDF